MTESEFKALLNQIRADLDSSANTFVVNAIPEADMNFNISQAEVWRRLELRINDAQDAFPMHCDSCRQEFVDITSWAIRLIENYLAGALVEPRKVWNVTYRSRDGQHGYSEVVNAEQIPEVDGYTIDNVSAGVVFKGEV